MPYEDIWQLIEDKQGKIWLGNISSQLGYIYNDKYHKGVLKNISGTIYPQFIRNFKNGFVFISHYLNGTINGTICIEKNDTISPIKIKAAENHHTEKISVNDYHPDQLFFVTDNGVPMFQTDTSLYKVNLPSGTIDKIKDFTRSELNTYVIPGIYKFAGDYMIVLNLHYKITKTFSCLNLRTGLPRIVDLTQYGAKDNIEYIYHENNAKIFYVLTKSEIFEFTDQAVFYRSYPISNITNDKSVDGTVIKTLITNTFWDEVIGTINKGLYINYTNNDNFTPFTAIRLADYTYVGGLDDKAQFWWNAKTSTLLELKANKKIAQIKIQSAYRLDNVVPYNGDTVLITGPNCYFLDIHTNKLVRSAFSFGDVNYATVFRGPNDMYGINIFGLYNLKEGFHKRFLDQERYKFLAYDSVRNAVWAYNQSKIFISGNSFSRQISTAGLAKLGISQLESVAIDNRYGNVFLKGQNNINICNPEKNTYTELFKNFNLKESSIFVKGGKLIVAGRFGVIFSKILGPGKLSDPTIYKNIKNINYNYIYDCQLAWNKLLLNTDKGAFEVTVPNDSGMLNGSHGSLSPHYKFLLNYNDSLYDVKENDTLTLSQKDLRLQFDVINPNGNGQLKYTYKLPGDSVWHELNANELNFPALSPDNYYKLILSAHDNVWRSDDLTLYIYIHPHWWQTHNGKRIVWFSVIVSILLLFTVAILITRQLVLRATLKRNLQMELELKSIYAQINPHFIFNTLNSALLLVSKNKMDEAYVHIAKFSRLLRSYIKSSRNKLITVAEEINNLRNYIDLQQTRFKDRFDYTILLDEKISAQDVKIPSLLLQPFVENAINHGILNSQQRGMLTIEFKKLDNENEIMCVIDDNGVGRKLSKIINEANTDKDESYGDLMIRDLVNIFNKYEQMNIEIEYRDKTEPETGTVVTIHIKNLQ